MIRLPFSILLLGLGVLLAHAADLPPLVLPQGVGVNIHFVRGHEQDLDLIRNAGFKFIRMDFGWASIERRRGEYDFSAYDELTTNLEERGLRALYILDYSNPLYEDEQLTKNPINGGEERNTASPQHPESVAAFARWAAAAAKHFQSRGVIWEIWNEPNIFFWRPKPDVAQYNALALATAKAVREADAAATIVGPATSEFPWEFLEKFLQAEAIPYLDAISVHPYRGRPPETAVADYERLRGLMEKLAPSESKRQLPIISGEWGYSSHAKGVSLETQAAYLVRQQLVNLVAGIPISIWYDWKNDGDDPKENEHNFGTVASDLKPKPAYQAVRALTRELGGFGIERRLSLANTNDFGLILTNLVGQRKIVAWTTAQPHTATIALSFPVQSVSGVDLNGEPVATKVAGQNVETTLSESPQYITIR
jgi:polysaccharide biosynthesis protein PslG